MANKIPVKPYIDADIWQRAEKIWDGLGVNNSVGIEQLLKIFVADDIQKISRETGVSHIEIITRLMRWFADLDHNVQLGILSGNEDIRQGLFAMSARKAIAGKIGRPEDRAPIAAHKRAKGPDHMK